MRELVVISGKGGTGKTTVVAALAYLSKPGVLVDCDVDAANLHLILPSTLVRSEDFSGGNLARINEVECSGCAACVDACVFGAISPRQDVFYVDPIACEGCGVCTRFCPQQAISFEPAITGTCLVSKTPTGMLVHAELRPGGENSGKLVTKVRKEALKLLSPSANNLILVDGPPGIGCPTIAAITGASMILVVTEPTPSGIHDMNRALDLAVHFHLPAMVCINKYDLHENNSKAIRLELTKRNIDIAGMLPYDCDLARVQRDGVTGMSTFPSHWRHTVEDMWKHIEGPLGAQKILPSLS